MRRAPFVLMFLLFWVNTATADVSVTLLKGKATGQEKAAIFVSVVDDAGRPIKGLSK